MLEPGLSMKCPVYLSSRKIIIHHELSNIVEGVFRSSSSSEYSLSSSRPLLDSSTNPLSEKISLTSDSASLSISHSRARPFGNEAP